MNPHFLAHQIGHRRRTQTRVLAATEGVNRNRRLVTVRDRGNDVLRPECGIAAEEHRRQARLKSEGIELGQAVAAELHAGIRIDPGKGVLLSHRDQHIVAVDAHVRFAGRRQDAAAAFIPGGGDLFEGHARQLSVVVKKSLGDVVVQDRDAFPHRVLLLPGGGLHFLEAGAHDDLDVHAAQPKRRAAAIHRRISAAEHDDAAPDRMRMAERHAGEPVDADAYVRRGLLAPGNREIAAARRAAADEYGVETFVQQRFQAIDPPLRDEGCAAVQDITDLFVDHFVGQTKLRDLAAHHAAGLLVGVEYDDFIAERREVAGHGQRSRAGPDAGDALAVARFGRSGHQRRYVALIVRGDPLEPTDRDRLLFDAPAAASRFAWAVARASQNSGKDVRFPVDHVGADVIASRDAPDVFGHWRMRRARPLTIHHFMKVVGTRDICRLQNASPRGNSWFPRSYQPIPAARWITPGTGRRFLVGALNRCFFVHELSQIAENRLTEREQLRE